MVAASSVLIEILRVAAAVGMIAVTIAVFRHRGDPVADSFLWTLLAMSLWALLALLPGTLGLLPTTSDLFGVLIATGTLAAGAVAALCSYLYIRRYTGHSGYNQLRTIGVLFVPVISILTVITATELWTLTTGSLPSLLDGLLQSIIIILVLYVTAVFFLGLYLLGRLARRYKQVSYVQVAVVSVGLLAPYVAGIASSLTQPAAGGGTVSLLPFDISFAGFLVATIAFSYALRTYSLFRPYPGAEYIARDEVIENLKEGILILDQQNRVIDMNPAAAQLTQQPTSEALNRPVWAVLDGLSQLPAEESRHVELQTPTGPRQFEIRTSLIRDGDDGQLGTTVRLRDVTERQTREQQLEVLTRVLRHNLRNDLDVALAYANEIEDPDIRTHVRSRLQTLVQIGNKARDVEEVLSTANDPWSEVDLGRVVRTVADRFRAEHDDCEIVVTAPEKLVIISHQHLLDRLLSELIENGIEHNDHQTPRVEITVAMSDEDGSAVEIDIEDTGPGIPDHERSVVRDGAETPLKHGTGIGLWIANWITESLGGELSFPKNKTGGAVLIRLTDARGGLDTS